MVDNYASTLLIKVSPEMKGAFQGLCKARGVSVSAELRRFMADQLTAATGNMGSRKSVDDPRFSAAKSVKTSAKRPNAKAVPKRDSKTPDLFGSETPQSARKATVKPSKVGTHRNSVRNSKNGQFMLNSAISDAMRAKK